MLAMARRTISCEDNATVYANPTRHGTVASSLGVATTCVACYETVELDIYIALKTVSLLGFSSMYATRTMATPGVVSF